MAVWGATPYSKLLAASSTYSPKLDGAECQPSLGIVGHSARDLPSGQGSMGSLQQCHGSPAIVTCSEVWSGQ
jgi:hypothetical protein